MNADVDPRALARLYLNAVLPCFAELVAHDEASRQIIAGWKCVFSFRIINGPAATLRIENGKMTYEPSKASGPTVDLRFFNERHLNAFFSGNKLAVPLIVWGFWPIKYLTGFTRLGERMEEIMKGTPAPVDRALYTRMTLMTAGLGLKPLAEYDRAAGAMLRTLPSGIAEFTIDGESSATVWFANRPGAYDAGWGKPAQTPDVQIRFADGEVAYEALRDELDTLAAVGSLKIKVDGLIPLADGLNAVMERLRAYLEP